jgi:hypothetical protein
MARAALVVVLPTPPFPDVITMILAKTPPSLTGGRTAKPGNRSFKRQFRWFRAGRRFGQLAGKPATFDVEHTFADAAQASGAATSTRPVHPHRKWNLETAVDCRALSVTCRNRDTLGMRSARLPGEGRPAADSSLTAHPLDPQHALL